VVDDESSTWRIVCLMLSRMAAIVVDELECGVVSEKERNGGGRKVGVVVVEQDFELSFGTAATRDGE